MAALIRRKAGCSRRLGQRHLHFHVGSGCAGASVSLSSRLMHRRPGANFSRSIPKQHPRTAASGREKERMDWMDRTRGGDPWGTLWPSPALGYLGSEAHWRPVDRAQRHGRGRLETGHSSWATVAPRLMGTAPGAPGGAPSRRGSPPRLSRRGAGQGGPGEEPRDGLPSQLPGRSRPGVLFTSKASSLQPQVPLS